MQRCAFELPGASTNAKGCLGYDRRAIHGFGVSALAVGDTFGQYSAAIVQGNVDQAIKWDADQRSVIVNVPALSNVVNSLWYGLSLHDRLWRRSRTGDSGFAH